jgi:hypothetical protein
LGKELTYYEWIEKIEELPWHAVQDRV